MKHFRKSWLLIIGVLTLALFLFLFPPTKVAGEPAVALIYYGPEERPIEEKAVVYCGDLTNLLMEEAGIEPHEHDAVGFIGCEESNGIPTAQNPVSTAYGAFQFLNATWATVGCVKSSDILYQLECADDYVKQRYGTWEEAVAYWKIHRHY